MRAWPLVIVGGLAAYVLRKRHAISEPAAPITAAPVTAAGPLAGRWLWPVPSWQGRSPAISDGFDSPRPGLPRHGGVDIMFERRPSDAYPIGSPNGSKAFVMPDGLVAVAASDGVVWSALSATTGFCVVIDHTPIKAATFYAHLEKLLVQPTSRAQTGEHVRAGQPIGIIGASPTDAEHLKHLHFELWLGGPSDRIDPAPVMRSWSVPAVPVTAPPRNAGFEYRRIGASGEPYPDWVRDLEEKSGVYLIRDADTAELLYVGSSRRHLYGTLTRHVQSWQRSKRFWRGQYDGEHDPGLTYERAAVEVAVRITPPDQALDEEARLIRRLRPRDNLTGQTEPVPF
jgi:hypothetical protein